MAPEALSERLSPAALQLPAAVLTRWEQFTRKDGRSVVLPDGCRDLVLHVHAGGHLEWMVSHLADTAYDVCSRADEFWLGYRLQPGAAIDAAALLAAVASIDRDASPLPDGLAVQERVRIIEARVLDAIDTCVHVDPRIREALDAIAHARSVNHACVALGVSERSLERLTKATTGEPPRYWRSLARVRRAAQALGSDSPLAAIAVDHGFSDQAHFSRECRRWLGMTPASLRASPALTATVAATGYA